MIRPIGVWKLSEFDGKRFSVPGTGYFVLKKPFFLKKVLISRKKDKEVMSVKKAVKALGALMLFVGTLGIVSPMCMCFFYSPKKPAALR